MREPAHRSHRAVTHRWRVILKTTVVFVFLLSSPAAASSVIIISVAGTGTAAFWGDGGLASTATVNAPGGVAVDSAGDVFIADTSNNRVRMVPASSGTYFGQAMTEGDIYTIAGTGTVCSTHTPAGCGYTSGGVAQLATTANLDAPGGVATDSAGNLFIADTTDNMVAMVARSACSSSCPFGLASTVAGDIYAIAGTGTVCSTHTPAGCLYNAAATSAKLDAPGGVAVDSSGNLFIADTTDNMVAMVAKSACSSSCPFGLASTTVGFIYAIAGTGTACSTHTPAGCLYNAAATSAKLDKPGGVGVDSSGNLFIADTTDQMVAMVARSACSSSCPFGLASTSVGFIYAIAGTGTACSTHTPAGCGYTSGGVAQLATSANIDAPGDVAVDSSGNVYIADTTDQMVAMVARSGCSSSCPLGLPSTSTGDIYAVAGTGTACSTHTPAGCGYTSSGVAQVATSANLDAPRGVAVDSSGNLYIGDTTDNMVPMVANSTCSSSCVLQLASTTVGDIYAIAGTGTASYTGDGGGAATTALNAPSGVAVDSSGDVFIADTSNDRVRMVPASSGTYFGQAMTRADIYTVAGTGTACSTHTPAGCGYTSGGVPQLATAALLDLPGGVAVDSTGNLYIADTSDNMVAMVARSACSSSCPFGLSSTTTGDIYALAGTGTACATHTPAGCGYTLGGVAQPATSANLDAPSGVGVDGSGNLYIADKADNMLALVADNTCASSCVLGLSSTTQGGIYDVAGTGTAAFWGDGGLASTATVNAPGGVAVDSAGDVFIADTSNNRVRMVPASSGTYFGQAMTEGDIYTIAGTGTACSTHTPAGCGYTSGGVAQLATTANLDAPGGVATDSAGNLFIADTTDNMVAMVARSACSSSCPFGLASTVAGDIYAIAGTGTVCSTHTPAGCLYNAAATSAKLDAPGGVAVDSSGNLFIADTTDNMVAMVAKSACSSSCPFGLASTTVGFIYAIAGTGTACSTHTPAGCLYNAAATSAKLDKPGGVGVDSSGNLFIADTTDQMVAMVARSACSSSCPFGLASTSVGFIYAIAGTGTACSTHTPAGCGYTSGGVAQLATSANIDAPGDVAVDSSGNVYIADTTDQMVAMVARSGCSSSCPLGLPSTSTGDIYAVAGTGTACSTHTPAGCGYTSSGVAQVATSANLDAPRGVAVDSSGNLYIGDTTDNMVPMVANSTCSSSCVLQLASTTVGDIYAIAGTGTASYTGDGGGAATTALNAPSGVAVDSSGDVFIADTSNDRVRMVPASSGTYFGQAMTRADIYTVAGTGTACSTHTPAGCGYTSGGVPQLATAALLDLPGGVAVDSTGNLYIADTSDNMVAMVARSACSSSCPFGLSSTTTGDIYALAGTGTACASSTGACGDTGGPASATVNGPSAVAVTASGSRLYVADKTDRRIRELLSTPTLLYIGSAISFNGTLNGLPINSVLSADVVPSTYSVVGGPWSLTITSTTFTTGTASLPTTATTVSAPIASCDAWFSVCTQVVPVAGDPTSYPFIIPAASTAPTAATFFSDQTGTGPQTLSFPFQLNVPASAKAGTYTSTWTVTIQSGP